MWTGGGRRSVVGARALACDFCECADLPADDCVAVASALRAAISQGRRGAAVRLPQTVRGFAEVCATFRVTTRTPRLCMTLLAGGTAFSSAMPTRRKCRVSRRTWDMATGLSHSMLPPRMPQAPCAASCPRAARTATSHVPHSIAVGHGVVLLRPGELRPREHLQPRVECCS